MADVERKITVMGPEVGLYVDVVTCTVCAAMVHERDFEVHARDHEMLEDAIRQCTHEIQRLQAIVDGRDD